MLRQRIPDKILNENGASSEIPAVLSKAIKQKMFYQRRWFKIFRRISLTLVITYFALPVWFYFCPWIRRQCVFLHNFHWPPFETRDLSEPSYWKIPCSRSFYFEPEYKARIGVWHLIPTIESEKCKILPVNEKTEFDDGRPVILYFHGNSMNRAALYRRELYRVLTSKPVDAHVVSFDYQGFGDSSYNKPSVASLVRDAEAIYKWLTSKVPKSRIIIWGHSLGSGVAIQLAAKISLQDSPAGIILESPFTNIPEATASFPLSFLHRRMPFFQELFAKPTNHPDTNFNTDEKISSAKVPIMILHAADDGMVSVKMGRKLRDIAVRGQAINIPRVEYVEFEEKAGCGHLFISKSPELPSIINPFIAKVCKY